MDSAWPQLSIGVIVTGRRNQPSEMSMRSPLPVLGDFFAMASRPPLSLHLEFAALRRQLSIYRRTGHGPHRPTGSCGPAWPRARSGWRNHLFFVKPGTVICDREAPRPRLGERSSIAIS